MDEQPVDTTLYSLSTAPPPERRDSGRAVTLYRVGTMTLGERRELCLIKNISAGGMLIRAYCTMHEGMALGIELKSGHAISGTVSWTNGHEVCVTFDQPIDVIEVLSASMEGPRPRMPRIEVECFAAVRDGATTYRVPVCDISQGGIKLQTTAALLPGCEVAVSLRGLAPLLGVVRWVEGGCCGVTFNRLLALPHLVNWLQEQRGALRAVG